MGRWSIILESLAPSEVFGIEIMSINQDLPYLSAMRSDEVAAKLIIMVPQRQYASWIAALIVVLMILGAGTTLYLFAVLVEWLAA